MDLYLTFANQHSPIKKTPTGLSDAKLNFMLPDRYGRSCASTSQSALNDLLHKDKVDRYTLEALNPDLLITLKGLLPDRLTRGLIVIYTPITIPTSFLFGNETMAKV